ncbi:MAG: class I fructose-bisphosphate aldolase [Anaerolineae bacterium]
MQGTTIRLRRLLPQGRRIIILPIDHGEFQGPRKGLISTRDTLQALSGYDAVLMSPGTFVRCGEFFADHPEVTPIVRLNWNADYCFQWGYGDGTHGRVLSPGSALALGADVALASVALGTGDPKADAASVELFARLAEEARAAGIPLGGEFYPGGDLSRYNEEEFHDLVLRSVRIVAELGADFIKTFYTGPRFAEVVESCPVPVIVLGAGKEDEPQALRKAEQGIAAGARGVVFGRNVFESDRPQAFLDALGDVVRNGLDVQTAIRKHGFA